MNESGQEASPRASRADDQAGPSEREGRRSREGCRAAPGGPPPAHLQMRQDMSQLPPPVRFCHFAVGLVVDRGGPHHGSRGGESRPSDTGETPTGKPGLMEVRNFPR